MLATNKAVYKKKKSCICKKNL